MKLTNEQKNKITVMFSIGKYTGEIAEKLNIPEYLVVNFLEDIGMYGYAYREREVG